MTKNVTLSEVELNIILKALKNDKNTKVPTSESEAHNIWFDMKEKEVLIKKLESNDIW